MTLREAMRRRLVAAPAVLVGLALVACGARSTLPTSGAGQGGAGSGGTQGSGAAAPACQTWSVAPGFPVALTDPSGYFELTDVVAEGGRVLVAANDIDEPNPDPTWRVRVVSEDLATVGPSQIVLKWSQNVTRSGLRIDSRFGHRGAMAWDEADHCRFVALAADGSAAAPPVLVDADWCYWLTATPSGFALFTSPNNQVSPLAEVTLDPSGQVLAKKANLVSGSDPSTYPLAHARFDDGSQLLAWKTGLSSIVVQHFSEAGDPMSAPKPVLGVGPQLYFALASLGSSALAAWPRADKPGEIWVEALDEDGNGGASGPVASGIDQLDDLAIAVAGQGVLVAWSKGQMGSGGIVVQPATSAGAASGAPMFVAAPLVNRVRVVGTPSGALLVYEAEAAALPRQVFATRLLCVP